jgi:hypothetical protein
MGLEEISRHFVRWSKHEEMKKYAEALEEWDDIVGETWDSPDSVYLSPASWINDTEVFMTRKERVDKLVKNAY